MRSLIGAEGPGWSSEFWMVGDLAFLQLRRIDERTVLINNIFVDAKLRGRGAGSRLMEGALSAHPEFEKVLIDVFDDNEGARRLYRALGFSFAEPRGWLEHPGCEESSGRFQLLELPQAQAVHAAFGFSMVGVSTPRNEYAIGRLGTVCFRLPSPAALEDPDLRAALGRLGSKRPLLAISESEDPLAQWAPVKRSRRGSVDLQTMLLALRSRTRATMDPPAPVAQLRSS